MPKLFLCRACPWGRAIVPAAKGNLEDGAQAVSPLGDRHSSIDVAYNVWHSNVNFTLTSPSAGTNWYRVADICSWAEGPNQVRPPRAEDSIGGQAIDYAVRGLLLLVAK